METIVGLFEHYEDAEKALEALELEGVENKHISVITRENDTLKKNKGKSILKGSVRGAEAGGLMGLLAGITALAIPGIGPVLATGSLASSIATALGMTAAGAGLGAATGSLVGALMDLGYTKDDAEFYTQGVSRGGVLISVNTDTLQKERVREILNTAGAVDLETRRREWNDDPEKKFFEGWNQNM